jgi:flavin reductase (DIM6/NTAB) family NADH-FMN oxidoreductase RutF
MDLTAATTLFAWMDREVWLVTARVEQRRGGLIATLVEPASIVAELPRVLVNLGKQHHTWELVQASGAFALHLLAEEHVELVWRFALASGRDVDKFSGLEVREAATGSPLLSQAVGWLDCRVETSLDTGDRTLYLAEVLQGEVTNFTQPLTARRLMELATPSRLAELQRRRQHDSFLDAEAIQTWRQQRAGG